MRGDLPEGARALDDVESNPWWRVEVTYDKPPVSINDAYTVFRGRKKLTKEGTMFKDDLAKVVAQSSFDWKTAHDLVYQHGRGLHLVVTLGFPNLMNKSWKPGRLTKTKGGNPRSRFKKKDASNYLKLIEDAVCRGSGIDDCNITDVSIRKRGDVKGYIHIELKIY